MYVSLKMLPSADVDRRRHELPQPALLSAKVNDVQQREQKDPDQVNKVPVKATVLDEVDPCFVQLAALQQNNSKENHPDNDMDGMEACH